MREWTREERYRKIDDVPEKVMSEMQERIAQSQYRQSYHIQPVTGLLNDPNGFSYFDGKWHLFYQWFPLGPVHGLKYWYHVTSTNLVEWENEGIGISPDTDFDSHGAYSGSGFVYNEKLHLMYTGNTRSENWERTPYQIMAVMDNKGHIVKKKEPLISGSPKGYTDHFRDPKIWQKQGEFYCVIGSQRENLTGTALIYHSKDMKSWELRGELKTALTNFGYMWECPDFFELDNHSILLFSPQGLEEKGDRYQNIYQSGYLIGDTFNYSTLELNHGNFQELDYGFDFYAPQTSKSPDGRRIVIGWMGLPEISYPTDREEWAHCLTVPRKLSIEDGVMKQRPIEEMKYLRKEMIVKNGELVDEEVNLGKELGNAYELNIKLNGTSNDYFGLRLFADETSNDGFLIGVNVKEKKLKIDRTNCGIPFATEYGTIRQMDYNNSIVNLTVFVDHSSVEVFVNDGEAVFTSRVFPHSNQQDICLFTKEGDLKYELEGWKY